MTQLTNQIAHEVETHLFAMDASDFDLTRAGWPMAIPTNLGNGQNFIRTSKKVDADGDVMWVTYTQLLGCIRLRVYND